MKFKYLNKEFESLRLFRDGESNLLWQRFGGYLKIPGYKHEDFYNTAKESNAFADIYLYESKKIVPCGGAIVIWKD